MKYILTSFLIAIASLVISCANNTGNNIVENSEQQPAQAGAENVITFKVNNAPVVTNGWNISRSIMNGAIVLNVTSNMHDEERAININVNGDKAGSYTFLEMGAHNKNGIAYGSYFPDYNEDMMHSYHFEDGEFVISAIDTVKGILDARFSGKVKNDKCQIMSITEGKVKNGKLKPGVTVY